MKIISFGKCNKFYVYIMFYVISLILNDFLLGQSYYDTFIEIKFFSSDIQKIFNTHYFFHQIIFHFDLIILAYLLFLIKKKYFSTKSKRNLSEDKIKLIYNDPEKAIKSRISLSFYILTIFIMIIEDQLLEKIFPYLFSYVDFWMIELIMVSYICSNMFNFKLYQHQKLSFYMNAIFPMVLKIVTVIQSKIEYLLIFGIIIYLHLILLRSIVNTKVKYYMDLKYISEEKILILYGFLGTIIFLFYSIITTLISENIFEYKKDKCSPYYDKSMFFENIKQYFEIRLCNGFNLCELFKELGMIILGSFFLFCKKYFFLLVIKFFTPAHIIFSYPLYFMLVKLILMLNNKIRLKTFFKTKKQKNIEKVFLDISGDIISIIWYIIYLEIIEFHCCKLDYNIKKNIIKRSIVDSLNFNDSLTTETCKEYNDEIKEDLNISFN